jgi:hypothetical protein
MIRDTRGRTEATISTYADLLRYTEGLAEEHALMKARYICEVIGGPSTEELEAKRRAWRRSALAVAFEESDFCQQEVASRAAAVGPRELYGPIWLLYSFKMQGLRLAC